jgi:hypothetical protein
MYRFIEPEVAGGLGKETEMDSSIHPPIVKKLHYEFEGWLGDDILETFPCFIVTDRLKNSIEHEKLSGIIFSDVIITRSTVFLDTHPVQELPRFFWAKIIGGFKKDDFFIATDRRLMVSEKAFQFLKSFRIDHALIEEEG